MSLSIPLFTGQPTPANIVDGLNQLIAKINLAGVQTSPSNAPSVFNFPITVIDPGNAAGAQNIRLSSPAAIGTNDVIIGNGYAAQPGAPYPVLYFRPTTPNSSMPVDLMPNTVGQPANTQKDCWIDICTYDFVAPNGGNQEFMRVGYNGSAGNYSLIGSNAFGSGTVRPLVIQPYGGFVQFGYPTGDGTGAYVQSIPMSTTAGGAAFHSFQTSSVVAAYVAQGTYNAPAASTLAGGKPFFMAGFYNGSAYVRTAALSFQPTAATMTTSDQGTDAIIATTKTGTTTRNNSLYVSNTGTQISDNGDAVSPTAGVAFEVKSTNAAGGLRFPNMTTTQKNALANVAGNVVYDTTLGKLCVNTGAGWQTITSA